MYVPVFVHGNMEIFCLLTLLPKVSGGVNNRTAAQ